MPNPCSFFAIEIGTLSAKKWVKILSMFVWAKTVVLSAVILCRIRF